MVAAETPTLSESIIVKGALPMNFGSSFGGIITFEVESSEIVVLTPWPSDPSTTIRLSLEDNSKPDKGIIGCSFFSPLGLLADSSVSSF